MDKKMEVYMINDMDDMINIKDLYRVNPPLVAAFDTEASGLSIFEDKPFLFQFGWYNLGTDTIYVGLIDIERNPDAKTHIAQWHTFAAEAPLYLAHNIKFDLHMVANIGVPYLHTNVSDTMFYIRFAHDNISPRNGGVLLGLKSYCAKYISPTAKAHDSKIQLQRSAIAKKYNMDLKQKLGWTMKRVDEFFKDYTNISSDFPTVQDYIIYRDWKNGLPKEINKKEVVGKLTTDNIPYTLVDRELIYEYGAYDIYWVILVYLQTAPVIEARETSLGLELENECIYPLWEMERQGLYIDTVYIQKCFYRLREYIRERRNYLKTVTGLDITCNQNKELLKYFRAKGYDIEGTDATVLNRLDDEAAKVVLELRTLEKWLSTYLMRFLGKEKVYTTINQVGAATLRMSSDFQQFPNGGIIDNEGRELFNPRRAVIVPPHADAILCLDYSQIELRVQALYTILVDKPDLQLSRAYMPYQCHTWTSSNGMTGRIDFDYTDPECLARAYDTVWYLNEDPEQEWHPVDVHGATTKAAFNIDETHPDYSRLRNLGKRVNFAKNYGAQVNKIKEMFPDESDETIEAIDKGYYTAFPGIKNYQSYCYDLVRYQPYATNLFGIRYWNVSGHNLINMLIQGSSATLLKKKIVELYAFLKPYKTKMLMPIHDEVQFITYEDELHLVPKLIEIMQTWDVYVPIVADKEITRTNWAEKEEMD